MIVSLSSPSCAASSWPSREGAAKDEERFDDDPLVGDELCLTIDPEPWPCLGRFDNPPSDPAPERADNSEEQCRAALALAGAAPFPGT